MHTVYLGLGSNLGDRKVNMRRALRLLPPQVGVEARSPVYETDPMYFTDQPKFYNMAARGKTKLSPTELLEHVKKIETGMGRSGITRNQPRVIDIDILAYDEELVSTDDLVIPHPRMTERAFVLVPLHDVAPRFIHPISKLSVTDMLKRFPDWAQYVRKTNVRV